MIRKQGAACSSMSVCKSVGAMAAGISAAYFISCSWHPRGDPRRAPGGVEGRLPLALA